MFGQLFNISGRAEKKGDILRVYRGAFEEAEQSQNPDIKIRAFDQVIDFCATSDVCRMDDSIKRNKVMYWTYNGLGDAWVAKTYQNSTEKKEILHRAIGYYREAVRYARNETEKINSLQRIAEIYKQIEDIENLNKTRESIVHSLSDEYKRLGYMQLVQNSDENPKTTEWLEQALTYVTKEEISFLGKCQNTLSICNMLIQSYKNADDLKNVRRITELMHRTARLAVQAMEDKAVAEKSREKQLEWYGRILEIALIYGKGDYSLKRRTVTKIVDKLNDTEKVLVDGIIYGRDGLKKLSF